MAVVTISRYLGSGSREIGQALGIDPGYRHLDHEGILERIKSAGLKWQKWAEEFDEHAPRLYERYDWSFRGFAALVQSTILDEAAADNVIIMGRGANYLLQDIPFALSIRMVAPLDVRAERIAEREGIDLDSARWLIEKTDRERAGFLYSVFGKDGKDPADYNMIFDSAQMSLDEIVEAIRQEIGARDKLKDESSVKRLRMKALAAGIRARLLTSLPFFIPTLAVEYSGGVIHLRGVVRLPREREMVLDAAKAMAGSVPIICELRYRQ